MTEPRVVTDHDAFRRADNAGGGAGEGTRVRVPVEVAVRVDDGHHGE